MRSASDTSPHGLTRHTTTRPVCHKTLRVATPATRSKLISTSKNSPKKGRTPVSQVIMESPRRTRLNPLSCFNANASLVESPLQPEERQAEREMLLHAQRESKLFAKKKDKDSQKGKTRYKKPNNNVKVGQWVITQATQLQQVESPGNSVTDTSDLSEHEHVNVDANNGIDGNHTSQQAQAQQALMQRVRNNPRNNNPIVHGLNAPGHENSLNAWMDV